MNFTRLFFLFIFIILLNSCADYKKPQTKEKIYYFSNGFALIYEDSMYKDKIISKKINNDEFQILHNSLKVNTPIKITNPNNSKTIETKIYRKANFPSIFNIVISKKIAEILELDENNPYVEVLEVKKNKTFIAKESNTFDEEKRVAEKAPVDEIKMDDLNENKTESGEKKKINYKFIIHINDFYYADTAYALKEDLIKKTNMNNISVKKINDKKYRLFVGPFQNFNALKTSFISLNNLGFENLNIYGD